MCVFLCTCMAINVISVQYNGGFLSDMALVFSIYPIIYYATTTMGDVEPF